MNVENIEKLKEALYRKGFGTDHNAELEQKIREGRTEFFIEHFMKQDVDEMAFRIHFKKDKDEQKDWTYLNSFDGSLFKNVDAPNQVREHNFPADKLITANEAYRMLKHGQLVSVNKDLINKAGEKYNTWIAIDINGAKDEYKNYPLLTYHQNYYAKHPFVVTDELKKLSVQIDGFGSAAYLDRLEKSLKKAHLIEVKGAFGEGFLAVNPAKGSVELFNKALVLIETTALENRKQNKNAPDTADDLKKNSREQVSWGQGNNKGRGHGI